MTYGLGDFARDIGRANGDVQRRVELAVRKTAEDIKGYAQSVAPVDTGALKGSITVEIDKRTRTVHDASITDHLGSGPGERVTADIVAEIGPTVHYGAYVELGTSRHGPQPYLRPAFEHYKPIFDAVIDQILREEGF